MKTKPIIKGFLGRMGWVVHGGRDYYFLVFSSYVSTHFVHFILVIKG